MKFQKAQNKILNKWKYHIKYIYHYKTSYKQNIKRELWESNRAKDHITNIDMFLKYRSIGEYERFGNNIYFTNLADAFNVRLYFADGISFIQAVL